MPLGSPGKAIRAAAKRDEFLRKQRSEDESECTQAKVPPQVPALWQRGVDETPRNRSPQGPGKTALSKMLNKPYSSTSSSLSSRSSSASGLQGSSPLAPEFTLLQEWTVRLEEELNSFNAFEEQLQKDLGDLSARRCKVWILFGITLALVMDHGATSSHADASDFLCPACRLLSPLPLLTLFFAMIGPRRSKEIAGIRSMPIKDRVACT